jgi:hypothetical protein
MFNNIVFPKIVPWKNMVEPDGPQIRLQYENTAHALYMLDN